MKGCPVRKKNKLANNPIWPHSLTVRLVMHELVWPSKNVMVASAEVMTGGRAMARENHGAGRSWRFGTRIAHAEPVKDAKPGKES